MLMSSRRWFRAFTCASTMGLGLLGIAGCQMHDQGASVAFPGDRAHERESVAGMEGRMHGERTADGRLTASMAFPTGQRATSALLVEKIAPAQVRAGVPFDYTLRVTNLTDQPLEHVIVYDQPLIEGMAMLPPEAIRSELPAAPGTETWEVHAIPQPGAQPGAQTGTAQQMQVGRWTVGALAPGQSRTLEVTGVTDTPGSLQTCTTATYQPSVCLTTEVVQPELLVERIVPAEAFACEPIPIVYRVTNVGIGTAENIRIQEQLPQGWTVGRANQPVAIELDRLAQGETREFTVNAEVDQRGEYSSQARAVDAFGQTYESQPTTTLVRRPELAVTVTAPDQAITGQHVTYNIEVTNQGDAVARDLVLRQTFAGNVEIVNATGNAGREGREAVWQLQPLEPGQSAQVSLTVTADEPTELQTSVIANAFCAQPISGNVATRFTGIASLLVEVVDTNDPVNIGEEEIYQILVRNQGSAEDTNIRIVANLPEGMEHVRSTGPGEAPAQAAEQGAVTFTIPRLGPGQQATMTVIGRAVNAGDVRFQVEVTSDTLTSPVVESEATRLY